MLEVHLLRFIDRLRASDWTRLAKFHPEIIQKVLEDWADRSEDVDPRLIVIVNQVISEWSASELNANAALALLTQMLNFTTLTSLRSSIEELMKRRLAEVVSLILERDELFKLPPTYEWRTGKLSIDQLIALSERYGSGEVLWTMDDLNVEQRRALYYYGKACWMDNDRIISMHYMQYLPKQERTAEARRHIKIRKFEAQPSSLIPYIALLPWDEAMVLQRPFLQSNDAEIRESALKCQIEAAKYDVSHLSDALKLALKCQYEQSTVRDKVMSAVQRIPGSRWKEQHLQDLAQFIRHCLDSSDLSKAGPYDLLRICTTIISFHPRWAAKQMAIIMKEYKGFSPRRFVFAGAIPTKDIVAILAEEMNPWLQKFSKTIDDKRCLSCFVSSLGASARYWPELLETMEKIFEDEDFLEQENYFFPNFKKCRPQSWFNIIPRLVEEAPTLVRSNFVMRSVHIRQQNLLPAIFSNEESRQCFSSGDFKLYKIRSGFERWSQANQESLAKILVERINDEDVSSEYKQIHIKQLAVLSFIGANYLTKFANSETPLIREVATRALGHLDGDEGVRGLLEALQDDRARFAIYSLRHSFKFMLSPEIFEILKGISMKKATVVKEIIRLIGDLDTEEGLHYLLELEKTELKTDVRVALFRALWSYLERDEAWTVFHHAAANPDPVIGKAICTIPDDGLSTKARRSLLEVVNLLIKHPAAEVRIAGLKRLEKMPLQDPDDILSPRLFELLQSPLKMEVQHAAAAVFKTYARTKYELIGDAFKQALGRREMLVILHEEYLELCDPVNGHMLPATRLILEILKTNRLTLSFRVKTMFAGLPWKELSTHILEIIPELHADALIQVERLIEENDRGEFTGKNTKVFEEVLAKTKDERARRLALVFLLVGVHDDKGWSEEQKERLERYKEDESVMVAEAAWNVALPRDDEKEEEGG